MHDLYVGRRDVSRDRLVSGCRWVVFVILPLYVLDQVTKQLVLNRLGFHEVIPVIDGFFNLVHYTNTGAAFGLFQQWPAFFLILSLAALAVLATLAWRGALRTIPARFGAALLVAGIFGNVTDRLLYGHVIDFLEFYVGQYYWPAFNVADSCICVATALFLWASFRDARPSR
jgi:signal peptidase II